MPVSTLLEAPPRRRPTSHRRRRRRPWWRTPAIVVVVLSMGAAVAWRGGLLDPVFERRAGASTPAPTAFPIHAPAAIPSPPGLASPPPTARPLPLAPGPINTAFPGLTTFRGNATRDWYGKGPMPKHPEVLWRYPASGGMCASSTDNHGTRTWCGTGWTGQPNVIASNKGRGLELRFGAYDDHYHFLDGRTGQPVRPDLVTGDLAKGSATSDPDGYPLYYGGSRDNLLRVMALDRPAPTVLWSLDANANPNRVWNDDWDGAPLVIGDYLLEGGENSWFYVIRLHRHYDKHHLVQVRPVVVMQVPGYDDQLLRDIGDTDVSIENSVAFDPRTGVVYFSNSGGLVQGWDVSDVLKGGSKYRRVFRFWDGDLLPGHRLRHVHRGWCRRDRRWDGGGALDHRPPRPHVDVAGAGGPPAPGWRLRRRVARLRHLEATVHAEGAVEGAARRVHRIDAGGVEGDDLGREPRRCDVWHRRLTRRIGCVVRHSRARSFSHAWLLPSGVPPARSPWAARAPGRGRRGDSCGWSAMTVWATATTWPATSR